MLRAFREWLTGFVTGCHFKKGRKCFALSRPFNCKPAILSADNTHGPLPGRHKAHFYNMLGYGGQTVSRGVAKSANPGRNVSWRERAARMIHSTCLLFFSKPGLIPHIFFCAVGGSKPLIRRCMESP